MWGGIALSRVILSAQQDVLEACGLSATESTIDDVIESVYRNKNVSHCVHIQY